MFIRDSRSLICLERILLQSQSQCSNYTNIVLCADQGPDLHHNVVDPKRRPLGVVVVPNLDIFSLER